MEASHTKVLAEADLITADRRGRWVWYRVDRERLASLHRPTGIVGV
ncbi:MAG: ArsR/SmtB family transcription factor [Acidimicrobiia bacterium]